MEKMGGVNWRSVNESIIETSVHSPLTQYSALNLRWNNEGEIKVIQI